MGVNDRMILDEEVLSMEGSPKKDNHRILTTMVPHTPSIFDACRVPSNTCIIMAIYRSSAVDRLHSTYTSIKHQIYGDSTKGNVFYVPFL